MSTQRESSAADWAGSRDPVCGMAVDAATPKGGAYEHRGTVYGFCSPRCREKFVADPNRYLGSDARGASAVAAAYTCPMHPEVHAAAPGPCPQCGMALEATAPT